MAGYCGICNTYYDCHYTAHEEECPGTDSKPVVSGSLEDYQQQTGDYGLVQAPEGSTGMRRKIKSGSPTTKLRLRKGASEE